MKRHLLACCAAVLLLASPAFAQGTESAPKAESVTEQVAKPAIDAKDHVKKEEKEIVDKAAGKVAKAHETVKAHKAEATKAVTDKAEKAKESAEKEASKLDSKGVIPTVPAEIK